MAFATDYNGPSELAELRYRKAAAETITTQMQAEIEKQFYSAVDQCTTPFEETAEFRDFVVWLCGFTDRESPPTAKEWKGLQKRAKEVAAKFATGAHDRALKELKEKYRDTQPYVSWDPAKQAFSAGLTTSSGKISTGDLTATTSTAGIASSGGQVTFYEK